MVLLPKVIESNERIASTFPDGLVAVFVGGTSGVGEYTVLKFAKYVPKPRVYIVGRSQEAADRIIKECKQLNPDGKFDFIKSDISLLVNVDDVCRQIKSKETAINILFESQGTMSFKTKTSEGLPLPAALALYSRMRFILNLLPLLQKADSLRRVVSVLAATTEGAIDLNNIPGEGFFLLKWRNQIASCQTLLLEEAARRAPEVSFTHNVPGIVKGGIMRQPEGVRLAVIIAISSLFEPFLQDLQTPPDACGERHLMLATSAMYPAGKNAGAVAGVPVVEDLAVARGSNGNMGSGIYSVDHKGESAPPKVEKLLAKFRQDGTADKVLEHVAGVCKKHTGTDVVSD